MAAPAHPPEDRPAGPSAAAAERVQGLLRERLAAAAALLEQGGPDQVGTVHGFRKHLKRARALLRLLADADGLALKPIETGCRDVARRLSALRDLDVTIARLDTKGLARLPEAGALRDRLEAERDAVLAGGVLAAASVGEMAGALAEADRRVAALDLSHVGDRDLRKALKKSHRRARKALAHVLKEPADAHFHELRKRAKRELYQREELAQVLELGHRDRTAKLDALCGLLGAQQDLAVLQAKAAQHGPLSAEMGRWLGRERDKLRRRLVDAATELYG